MAEIKSTLDLVMERTQHLTMSAEEKAGQQKKDVARKLNGLLQQYEDSALTLDELVEKVKGLQADSDVDDPMLVVSSVVPRIQPERDNAHWLALIQRLVPAILEPLAQSLAHFREELTALTRECGQIQLERFARDYGIKGSAVAPNVNRDASFRKRHATLKNETLARIEALLQGPHP